MSVLNEKNVVELMGSVNTYLTTALPYFEKNMNNYLLDKTTCRVNYLPEGIRISFSHLPGSSFVGRFAITDTPIREVLEDPKRFVNKTFSEALNWVSQGKVMECSADVSFYDTLRAIGKVEKIDVTWGDEKFKLGESNLGVFINAKVMETGKPINWNILKGIESISFEEFKQKSIDMLFEGDRRKRVLGISSDIDGNKFKFMGKYLDFIVDAHKQSGNTSTGLSSYDRETYIKSLELLKDYSKPESREFVLERFVNLKKNVDCQQIYKKFELIFGPDYKDFKSNKLRQVYERFSTIKESDNLFNVSEVDECRFIFPEDTAMANISYYENGFSNNVKKVSLVKSDFPNALLLSVNLLIKSEFGKEFGVVGADTFKVPGNKDKNGIVISVNDKFDLDNFKESLSLIIPHVFACATEKNPLGSFSSFVKNSEAKDVVNTVLRKNKLDKVLAGNSNNEDENPDDNLDSNFSGGVPFRI